MFIGCPAGIGVIIVMGVSERARLVGMNHIAIEVDDVDKALDWYAKVFDFTLRGRSPSMAFIDMGDQFLALSAGRMQPPDAERHIGLVVDDLEVARKALEAAGATLVPSRGLDFLDPWGNHFQVVEYSRVQFTKAPRIMSGMRLELDKSPAAVEELREKGLAD
jgi:catechol 2,3-dioxygenase-like lactoylglutathione lyase family enzyme